jgi:hypothetical protein
MFIDSSSFSYAELFAGYFKGTKSTIVKDFTSLSFGPCHALRQKSCPIPNFIQDLKLKLFTQLLVGGDMAFKRETEHALILL